jgi:uncharacterized protein (DUF2249 family)
MNNPIVKLDVREDLRNGREPFTKIMRAAAEVRRGGSLLIVAPFQPVPLFTVLKKLGFNYTAKSTDSGDWEVLFKKESKNVEPASPPAQALVSAALPKLLGRLRRRGNGSRPASAAQPEEKDATKAPLTNGEAPGAPIEIDARGLEPPQPMVKILEALAQLPEGAELKARTDRRPMHLYAQLEQRGFRGETAEEPDGSFLTYVRRV